MNDDQRRPRTGEVTAGATEDRTADLTPGPTMGAATDPTADPAGSPSEEARFEARVLRAFVRDGRLVSIPAQDRKRQVILRWLVDTCFQEDRAFPERDVNLRLALIHPDVAALRRYLVDAGLMTRTSGEYRRVQRPADGLDPTGAASEAS
jgi:hypothetical protein